MLNKRLSASQAVARELFKYEEALDQAFALGAQLSAKMVESRMEARLSATIGQEALENIVKSLNAIATARRELVDAHHELRTVADRIGLATVGYGDLLKPPPEGEAKTATIKAVA